MQPDSEATFLHHTSCDECGSSDANGVYDDGHTFCFSCQTHKPGSPEDGREEKPIQNQNNKKQEGLLSGVPKAIPARGLTEASCKKWGYLTGQQHGQPVQLAVYRDKGGKPIAQKVRTQTKQFSIVGDAKQMTLYGSHLWHKGKKLVVVEGEICAISLSQIQNHKWPVVSLSHGAPSAVKTLKANWDYLMGFEEIILMFDMDEVGQNAALACAELLPVGRAKIAYLPAKDVNDCLIQGKSADVINAIFQAREYRPDGIKSAHDYRDIISVDETASSLSWPYSMLNERLMGIRKKELVCLASGSGCGKTTFCKEVAYHLMQSGQKVGLISLEEAPKRTLLGLVGIHLNKNLLIDRSQATDQEVIDGFDDLFKDRTCVLYDSFGVSSVDTICQRIQYMARALDCDFIILDHVTMLTANMVDERRELDKCVTQFRTLVQELDIGMIMVSHLTRPSGRGHEDGAAVSLSQLRSSHSLAQLSDAAIGLQKDADDPDSDFRMIRVLKNRFSGSIGDSGTLFYQRDTGRLIEAELVEFTETENDEGEHNAERTT
jgi:twinkle protein